MQYFHSKKAWMAIEIMIQVLAALDRKLDVENRKGLFPDSASFHPETLQGNLKSLCFYPKIPLFNYSLVMLVSSEVLRLSITSKFWNILIQGLMMEKNIWNYSRAWSSAVYKMSESSIRTDYSGHDKALFRKMWVLKCLWLQKSLVRNFRTF